MDYDLLKDFEPIAQVPGISNIIVTRKTVPANNLKELISWLNANQDKVSVGTSGVGGASHIAGVFFQNAIAGRFQFVPYRGAGPAMNDLVAGQIDLMVDASPDCLPHLRAGAIKAYAVMRQSRLAAAPDATVDEVGCPDFTSPYGTGSGRLRALRTMSSASSMPLPCTRWPIHWCVPA